METKILKLLGRANYVPSNVPQLIGGLGLHPSQQQELQEVLRTLETEGKVLVTKGHRYILAQPADMVAGIIQINRAGKGFLLPDEPGAVEIVIQESATSTALNGDRVLVRRDVKPRGLRPRTADEAEEVTGTVVRILERKRNRLVGTLKQAREFLYVVPDDPRIPHHISVPPARDTGRPAIVGDKVVVELTQWENRFTPPEGEIVEVLGPPDAEGVDMLSVLRNYGLPLSFPREVLDEANAIVHGHGRANNEPSEDDFVDRLDCRDHMVITIDPDDAKDFDDAICLQRQSKDHWKLWVHIADVSHYVKPGSLLDKEAYERGNSTYLVDRVIPMLPEALSNELCSLKPGVARLTKCVEFDLATDGTVVKAKFHSAVIRSQRRFTYQEAYKIIQREPQDDMERMLHAAHQMAQRIRAKRFRSGALDLEFPENKIRLDERGRVLRIERIENDESHQLIEEYMLLANEAVAGRLMSLQRPSVYRVHEKPKAKRLEAFQDDVLGHRVPCGDLTKRDEVQKLLRTLEKLPIGPALKIGFLRSLMRARYAVDPLGHYGLNKQKYTHFTSPIRRYSDLVVHRTLFNNMLIPVPELKKTAEHISNTERISADAERDSKDVKLYAHLKAQLKSGELQTYQALVTDVRNFGFFVDVTDLGMSGLIHLSSLTDDFFIFDDVRNQLVGRHSRRVIKLGDRLSVQIYRIDETKKQVDFQLAPQSGDDGRDARRSDFSRTRSRSRGSQRNEERSSRPSPRADGVRPRTLFPSEERQGSSQRPRHDKPVRTSDPVSPEELQLSYGRKRGGKGRKPDGPKQGSLSGGSGSAGYTAGFSKKRPHSSKKSAPRRDHGHGEGAGTGSSAGRSDGFSKKRPFKKGLGGFAKKGSAKRNKRK